MKLKVDDKGNAVVQDGCPVYIYDDGREAPFDAKSTLDTYTSRISNLEDEKNRHFSTAKELKDKLKLYDGVDPEKARNAIVTVQNLKDKQLLDSQGIEVLKNEMRTSFESEKRQLNESFHNVISEKESAIQALNNTVHDLMVTQRFSTSEFFAGEKPKTIYPPEDAAKIFGHHFSVEKTDDSGRMRIVAKDSNGNTILSRKNHGDPAGFDEAIEIIIDKHPNKNRFLMTQQGGGPGRANGNLNHGDSNQGVTGQSKIAAGLKKQFGPRF